MEEDFRGALPKGPVENLRKALGRLVEREHAHASRKVTAVRAARKRHG